MRQQSERHSILILAWLMTLGGVRPVWACSVCFGDPDSAMARGALMGVYVLAGVIGFVLLCVAGTGLYWVQRGRRIARSQAQAANGV